MTSVCLVSSQTYFNYCINFYTLNTLKHTFLLLFPVALTDSECVDVRVLLWIPTQKFSRFWTTVALERKQNHLFSIKVLSSSIILKITKPDVENKQRRNRHCLKKHWLQWGALAPMSVRIVPHALTIGICDGELILMAITSGSNYGFGFFCLFLVFLKI